MFDVGFQELTLIGVIALIVVGPERLPKMARTIGLWMGKIRYYVGQVKSDIEREVRAQELKEMLDKPARELDDLYKVAEETKGTLDQAKAALGEAKAALEGEPASISTPNEPAAGSIFPTELPAPGAESEPAGPPRNTAGTTSPETAPVETDTAGTASPEAAPVEAAPAGTASPETAPVEAYTPGIESTETAPPEAGTPDAGSTETPPVQAGAQAAAPAEAETRAHDTVPVATDVGENDERSSERI